MISWKTLTEPTATKVALMVLIQFGVLCVLIQVDTKSFLQALTSSGQPAAVQTVQAIGRRQTEHEVHAMGSKRTTDTISSVVHKRTAALREQCGANAREMTQNYPDYSQVPSLLRWIWMSSPYHELFYCATPKCGSTTWKSYLMEDLNLTWHVDTHEAARRLGLYSLYKRTSLSEVEFLQQHRPKNRLLIVRNPWARLASAYDDKILDKKWKLKRLCTGWQPYAYTKIPSFEQFVDCVLHNPKNGFYEAHTHPLTALCAICHMDYNIVLKLEEMHDAEPFLMNQLHFHIKPKYRPPRKMKNNKYKTRYSNVTEKQIRQLQDIYKYDIQLFHYPRTPFD